jgi:hypothetical protein
MRGISAGTFCCQVAAWVPNMFSNFYWVKSYRSTNNLATTEAREKLAHIELPKNFRKILMHVGLNLKNIQLYLKISHRFLVTTKVFIQWKSLTLERIDLHIPFVSLDENSSEILLSLALFFRTIVIKLYTSLSGEG